MFNTYEHFVDDAHELHRDELGDLLTELRDYHTAESTNVAVYTLHLGYLLAVRPNDSGFSIRAYGPLHPDDPTNHELSPATTRSTLTIGGGLPGRDAEFFEAVDEWTYSNSSLYDGLTSTDRDGEHVQRLSDLHPQWPREFWTTVAGNPARVRVGDDGLEMWPCSPTGDPLRESTERSVRASYPKQVHNEISNCFYDLRSKLLGQRSFGRAWVGEQVV